ncbi:MAG: uroporphyrinogen-III C-methyltransferase [Burkholderiales bacterium]|nr:uroporphyrinogen-III C-methyltransferase [Burkholderiales bacterium]
MTEPARPAADDPAPTAGAPAAAGAPSGARAAANTAPPRRGGVAILWFAVIALAAALVLEWYDSRDRIATLRDDTAARVREAASDAREAVASVKEMRESLRELQARVGAAEARLAESRSREVALDAMYQELARGRDDWLLAETEQTVQIAAQQLQLARNVPAALAALQTVDARLARADRPEFAALRTAVAADIERLKNTPSVDIAGLTAKIDRLIEDAERLPLRSEERPIAPRPRAAPESGPWWERWMAAGWDEIKSLVRVERIDVADPRLLAPEHAYFLRENLKLRLLHARVALIQRNEATFRGDLKQAREWLTRYFDPRDKSVAAAQAAIAQLDEASLRVELPALADSLGAVRRLREPREGR